MLDRNRLAQRAQQNGLTARNAGPVGTDPGARTSTEVLPYGFTGTRRHGNKRTAKGGSSTGGARGCWATVKMSSGRGPITMDSRWSK